MSMQVNSYGWSNENPECCDYVTPAIIKVLAKLGKPLKVCDVGCGNGSLISMLHQLGYRCCGVEQDAEGCHLSKLSTPNASFYNLGVQDDATIIVKEQGLFDVVISTEVIEHLYAPHLLPAFAKQLLNPESGYLVISTPYHGYLKNLFISILNKWDSHHTPLWHGGHIKFFSKSTLIELLDRNGFHTLKFIGVGRAPLLWKSMIIVAKLK